MFYFEELIPPQINVHIQFIMRCLYFEEEY